MSAASARASNKPNYAVLIDADNCQHPKMSLILAEINEMGVHLSVRRAYGDFTAPQHAPWNKVCLAHSIVPVQADSYASGKATTDFVMMMDAMDLLHTDSSLQGFVLMSSDSDFLPLAQKLREAGKRVVGVGHQQHPMCDQFYHGFIMSNALRSKPMAHSIVKSPSEVVNERSAKVAED
ncbi:OST-HTH/LOTUS domain [Fragilaria crotonensis]|nr:OST-HTH/LOTUS domain [Fragilaria crotonensis]